MKLRNDIKNGTIITLILAFGIQSVAANKCQNLISKIQLPLFLGESNKGLPLTQLDKVNEFKKVKMSQIEKTQILKIVDAYGLESFSNTTVLAKSLADIISQRSLSDINKGQELAGLSSKIYEIFEDRLRKFFTANKIVRAENQLYNLDKNEVSDFVLSKYSKSSKEIQNLKINKILNEYNTVRLDLLKVKYNFAEQVSRLESFKISEYDKVTSHALTDPGYTLVSLTEYPKFAMALATNTQPPKKYGTGGVLSVTDYRDILANNLWLFTLQGHDLKHIHYANAHPMATASIFRSARSKNHLRFILIAALYEGVDVVQYSYETAIAKHFSEMGYSLEHGLLHLATAKQSELTAIAEKIGIDSKYGNASLKDWKPSLLPKSILPDNAKTADKLEQDIIRFVNQSVKDLSDPKINIYMRPDLIPDGVKMPAGTSNKPGEDLHYNSWY